MPACTGSVPKAAHPPRSGRAVQPDWRQSRQPVVARPRGSRDGEPDDAECTLIDSPSVTFGHSPVPGQRLVGEEVCKEIFRPIAREADELELKSNTRDADTFEG